MADALDRARGGKVHRHEWTVPELKRQLDADPENAMRKYRAVFAEGRGVAWDKTKTFNARHGIEVCGLDQWLREHPLVQV
ncbi:hypothetical protein D3C85_1799300 [compost metagenome]